MNRFEALVSLNMVPAMGSNRLKRLLDFFDSPQDVLKAPAQKLMAVAGIGQAIASGICSLKEEDLGRELDSARKAGLEVITLEDAGYPENLKNIYDPPIVLYLKGQLRQEDRFAIAVVGSRRASFYGLSSAQRFSADLAGRGFTIVSGLARGIDTYAHRGALSKNRRTIAVIGSGFNRLYPPENEGLSKEIAASGAVVSEFPMNMPPLRENFPRRNRVISGLSLGVLVVEAARNSGALITADFALEQGREVFALPGEIDSDKSLGTNGLIKQGAKLVSSVEDVLEEFEILWPFGLQDEPSVQKNTPRAQLNSRESDLYNIITKQPIHLDDLIERSNISITQASGLLLGLQMKKLIKELPGKQFVRAN